MGMWSKIGGAGKKMANAPVDKAKKLMAIEEAKQNWNWMTTVAKTLMPGSVKAGRIETFERAMERQNVSAEDLERIYTNHVLRFWISGFMLLCGWLVTASYAWSGHWLALLPALGFSAICGSQMFVGSFRAHQVATRKFCDVSEWVANRDAWVPLAFELPPAVVRRSAVRAVAPVKKASSTGAPSSAAPKSKPVPPVAKSPNRPSAKE